MNLNQKHPYHIVDPSPWPITSAFAALSITSSTVMYMHNYSGGLSLLGLGFLLLLLSVYAWWRDVIREATYEGHHTLAVQKGLRLGMLLFIVSEVMFFVAFFWGFFHSSLSPVFNIGGVWPPVGIEIINPWGIPLLNTAILLSSGFFLTWAHYGILVGSRRSSILGLSICIVLAIIFTGLQGFEYVNAPFSISDGIYGSVFFMSTGFHGFHVFIGTIFLSVCLGRLLVGHFSRNHHLGFEAASWYWHFVDVVWLFLFICIYWWGS
jgi:cytochrome c oxidase subunit 3